MNRPTGVTVLSVLCFVGAAFCVLCGIALMAGGGFLAAFMNQQARSGAGSAGLIAGLGAAIGVAVIVFGAIYVLVGWGLWALKEWARIVTIVLSAIGAAFQLPGLMRALLHFSLGGLVWTAFWLAVDIVIIWYLLTPPVKAAFQQAGQPRPASA